MCRQRMELQDCKSCTYPESSNLGHSGSTLNDLIKQLQSSGPQVQNYLSCEPGSSILAIAGAIQHVVKFTTNVVKFTTHVVKFTTCCIAPAIASIAN